MDEEREREGDGGKGREREKELCRGNSHRDQMMIKTDKRCY